jgi:hypothetical protein
VPIRRWMMVNVNDLALGARSLILLQNFSRWPERWINEPWINGARISG